ncbi:hypothetical protein [Gracilibacillus timonensis]|uniref:hypothetical protein n=1 Tax=Gracilibacillus timonensis TaxID=1816696 RepID=UPI000826BC61|nr:hypothetical protein [Gracilibacillus timonensis]
MQWLQEVPKIKGEKNGNYFGLDFSINKLTLCNEPKETIVTHFFLRMTKNQINGLMYIPITDEVILEQVKTELAPFFHEVKLVSSKGKVGLEKIWTWGK